MIIFKAKKYYNILFFIILSLISAVCRASFIEATMGTAVVNDATAAYNNPAALTLLKNSQAIVLATLAEDPEEFTGTITRSANGSSQSGASSSHTNYFLPSGYVGMPLSDRFFFGLAVIANNFNRDADQGSILRYVMSDNNVKDVDFIPALGVKLNHYLSLGAGLNFSQADFLFTPISGFPSLGVPDTQSHNEATANAFGGDFGILLQPSRATQIGFNYRSAMTYHFGGTSQIDGNPAAMSNNFSFDFWTPARYVLSINQFLSKNFGVIGTVQWIKWDIYNQVNAHGIVTQVGPNPVVLPNVTVPYYFHNAWMYTLGGYYQLSPKWIIRTAGTYMQSPGNPNYQITQGDSVILGASIAYKLSKALSLDASYAHGFNQNQAINIENRLNTLSGVNQGYRDSVSLKITLNT